MTSPDLRTMSIDQLVDYFADTAVAQEEAILGSITADDDPTREPAVKRMQELYGELARIDSELRTRGREARLALMKLYDHDNAQVNLEAARYTLGVAPEEARERIQTIADSRWPPQYIEARTIIGALENGNLKPD